MAIKILVTEFLRDLQNALSTFIFSLLLGFILLFFVGVADHLNKVFKTPNWNVDLVILPKGTSPELTIADLLKGEPDGLIPIALFNTLMQQSQGTTVKLIGFIPYKNSNGVPEVAVTDTELKNFVELKNKSIWSDFTFTDINVKRPEFQPKEMYETPEWHDQVLMGALVKGSTAELTGLKELIDRKTVAQAFFVGHETSATHAKLEQLKKTLYVTTALIALSTLLGLLLALKNMNSNRKSLELVLAELKFETSVITQFKLMQIFLFILLPIALGCLLSQLSFNFIMSLII
ncbi:MAG: hypothetical protein ACXVAX_07935 [Pseudobdellovibrio sp.]